MKGISRFNNRVVAALFAALLALPAAGPGLAADTAKIDDLLTRLAQTTDEGEAGRIQAELEIEWSKSDSPTIDLLARRGNEALEMGDAAAAVEHFTALIDHAPDHLAGYDGRAAAYYMTGDIGPALADIAFVLNREPRHFGALTGLAVILEESEDYPRALAAYRAAAALHPHLAEVNDAIARLEKQLEGQEL
jgi:tetratricopeptide (TPR) repeat protein